MSSSGQTVTCTACGSTGPVRPRSGLCRPCYARASHMPRTCAGCGQVRRHLAGGLCQRCYRLSRTRHVRCTACDQVRPIYFGDRCERCKQRARLHPGRCQGCGRQATLKGRYCRACLEYAAERVGSCADCLCWTGLIGGRCRPCRLQRWKHPLSRCPCCDRQLPLGAAGHCRLCLATSRATGISPAGAAGIQLFMWFATPAVPQPLQPQPPLHPAPRAGLGQLRLTPPSANRAHARLATPIRYPAQQQLLDAVVGYGQTRGWSPSTMRRTRRGLATLLADAAFTTPLDAQAVRQFLNERRLPALRVVEFLTDQGLVTIDDQAALDGWLARHLQPLPTPICAEVHAWVDALRGRGPRAARPRRTTTIRGYVAALEVALLDWAARYQSLRQVTHDDVTAQLEPVTGPTRLLALAAMRSLFKTLKAQRVTFTNPTAGLIGRHPTPSPALALDPTRRSGLLSQLDRPDERLIVLLAGVHALRRVQICALTLDDVDLTAKTLLVGSQPRHLDALTIEELHGWLRLRRQRWPTTANPYLLVNKSTAGGLAPVSRGYVQEVFRRLGLTAQDLRVDRLLAEVHATGGDPLKLGRLFGLSDPTAIRYCAELGPLDQPGEFNELTTISPPKHLQYPELAAFPR